MPIKLILFTSFFDIIFSSTTQWKIKSKYLSNATNIETDKVLRKNNYHDYNFDDWEETTQLLYFDDTNTKFVPTKVSTTLNDTNSETSTLTQGTETLLTIKTDLNVTEKITTDEITHRDSTTVNVTDVTTINTDDITTDNVTTEITTIDVDDTTTKPSDYEGPDVPEVTDVVSSTPNTTEDPLVNYLTTTEAEYLTPDIQVINNSLPVTEAPTVHPLLLEVRLAMESYQYGYYTSLLITFMRIIASMNEAPLETLKLAFYEEIQSAHSRGRLSMVGTVAQAVLLEITEMIAQLRADQIKSQATAYHALYINRRTQFSPQTNAIFDILDSSLQADHAIKIISTFADIQAFPNVTKTAHEISKNVIENSFFMPYSRIRGTEKEKLLMLELENAVRNRMFGRLRRHYAKKTTTIRQSKLLDNKIHFRHQKNVVKQKQTSLKYKKYKETPYKTIQPSGRQRQPINLKEIKNPKNGSIPFFFYFFLDHFDFDRTTSPSTTDMDFKYLRNETIMKKLKHRIKLYKKKFREIRKEEKKKGSKRGKTTTTTTTTIKPKMRKSKYYIRKYVKKNLYKMKTTTPTTTKSRWFRKWYHDNDTMKSCNSYSNENLESKSSEFVTRDNEWMGWTRKSKHLALWKTKRKNLLVIHNNKNSVTPSVYTTKHKVWMGRTKFKDIPVWTIGNNRINVHNGNIYNSLSKPNVIIDRATKKAVIFLEDSDYSSDETKLKAKVLDVLVHGKKHDLALYKDERRYDKRTFQSSNEEPILKANVYKAFGYENNFADRLKTT